MTEPTTPQPPVPASLPPASPPPPAQDPASAPAAAPVPIPPAPTYGVPAAGALVAERKTGPGLLVRAVWFIFVGWWLTGFAATAAWFLMITIIGLPLGIWMINRIPTVLTLRPRTSYVYAYTDAYGRTVAREAAIDQPPWYIRGLWFLLVGWWASAIVMVVGYALCLLILTLPIGLMLFNRVPFVASLYRY